MQKQYDPDHYKVVFCSSAPIGVPFLQVLFGDKRFEVVGVVTQCDKPSGRGMQMCENVIKVESKKYLTGNKCRYFLLIDSLHKNREKKLHDKNIPRTFREDRGIVIYADIYEHEKIVHALQELLKSWLRYFDTRWAYNLIIYKNRVFDLQKWENDKAKEYGRSIGIPEEQLDWSAESNDKLWLEMVQTPTKINPEKSEEGEQFAEWLKSKNPDFLVVIAYWKIIPQAILDIPTIAPINIHGSLLPKYRGASPLQSVFLNNEKETGITIMKMNAWLDTGDMIDTLKFKIPFDRTVKNVIEKMQEVWPKFLVDTLRKYGKKMLGEVKQNDAEATLCWKIEKESWLIDPRKDSMESIYPKYRWFYLRPKIHFNFNKDEKVEKNKNDEKNIRVIIEEMKLNEILFEENKKSLLIGGNNELNPCVEKLVVKPEGKKAMAWYGFVNGYLK